VKPVAPMFSPLSLLALLLPPGIVAEMARFHEFRYLVVPDQRQAEIRLRKV